MPQWKPARLQLVRRFGGRGKNGAEVLDEAAGVLGPRGQGGRKVVIERAYRGSGFVSAPLV